MTLNKYLYHVLLSLHFINMLLFIPIIGMMFITGYQGNFNYWLILYLPFYIIMLYIFATKLLTNEWLYRDKHGDLQGL